MALNLEEDMKKFKTWAKFNQEFEKRLNRKERATAMNIKKQKGDVEEATNKMWRGY